MSYPGQRTESDAKAMTPKTQPKKFQNQRITEFGVPKPACIEKGFALSSRFNLAGMLESKT
jgi:hypothetical protein